MSGYAAFALCGPKNVRDSCLNKAKPALNALHTVCSSARTGKVCLFLCILSAVMLCCVGMVVFMCCKLQCVLHYCAFVLRSLALA